MRDLALLRPEDFAQHFSHNEAALIAKDLNHTLLVAIIDTVLPLAASTLADMKADMVGAPEMYWSAYVEKQLRL